MANFKDKPVEERIDEIKEKIGLKYNSHAQEWMKGKIKVGKIIKKDKDNKILFYHGSNNGFEFKYLGDKGRPVEYYLHMDIYKKDDEGEVPEDTEHCGYLYITEDSCGKFEEGNEISFKYVYTLPFKQIGDKEYYFIDYPDEKNKTRAIIRTLVEFEDGKFAEMELYGMIKADKKWVEDRDRINVEIAEEMGLI